MCEEIDESLNTENVLAEEHLNDILFGNNEREQFLDVFPVINRIFYFHDILEDTSALLYKNLIFH